ncbi:hypothetical protein DOT_6249, partial [Desulfosporosinus sp. OT]
MICPIMETCTYSNVLPAIKQAAAAKLEFLFQEKISPLRKDKRNK